MENFHRNRESLLLFSRAAPRLRYTYGTRAQECLYIPIASETFFSSMFLGSNEEAHLGALINSSHVSRLFRSILVFAMFRPTIIIVFYFDSSE